MNQSDHFSSIRRISMLTVSRILVTFVSCFVLGSLASSVRADDGCVDVHLQGIEIAKGIDWGAIRYGATFVGEVLKAGTGEKIGFWQLRQHFRGRENIEVCGMSNDVVWLRLEVSITAGAYAGHKLVLGMQDWWGRQPDAWWLYWVEPCGLGGFGCECPPADDVLVESECSEATGSNLAYIPTLDLRPWWGTTLPVADATLEGWLCHQYPLIPRVSGVLTICPH
jgi:hypothetical protein